MAQLREEELNLLIAKASQFRAEHIVNTNVLGVATALPSARASSSDMQMLAAHARYETVSEGSRLKCSD